MKGFVEILKMSTHYHYSGIADVEVSFIIDYEDGQTISTEVAFSKYNYSYSDIMTCIQKYFKGDLKFR